jgi:hypothetical protein
MNLKEHLMASAERELGAFMTAVSELFGTEHARRAADDWVDELERIDTLPETGRDFRAITIAAAARLATWLNADGGQPDRRAPDTAVDEVGEPIHEFIQ